MPDATNNPSPTRPHAEARIYRQGTSTRRACQGTDPIGNPCPHKATRLHTIEWRDHSGLGQYLPLSLCLEHEPEAVA